MSETNVETWSGKTRHDENFPVGSMLVSRKHRPAIHAYYDFARNADDIADSPELVPQDKINRLNIMEDVLLGRRQDGSPSATALRASLAQTGVTSQHATDLLKAFRQDAIKNRYETIDDLYAYCQYSAVPVGRYVLDVHGESHKIWPASDALCSSLQILNHMQDCAKDLRELNRCYLPKALMDHFGASIEDLRGTKETPALRRVFTTLIDRLNRMNHAAADLPLHCRDTRLRLETGVIHSLAVRLTRKLEKNDPIKKRVKLAKGDFLLSTLASLSFLI